MPEFVRTQTAILLRRLAYQVSLASKSHRADSIHDLRVAIRRLSRCLRVFSQFYPDHSWKKIRRELSALLHMAGEIRDRDIALELFAEAGIPEGAAMVTRLKAERGKAARDLQTEIRRWKNRNFSRKWREKLELLPASTRRAGA